MRKSAWIALGAGAAAIVALAVVGRPSGAQQPAAPPSVVLSASDSASFKGPRQPVYFRHDIHAGQYQITCQYCHYSVAYDAEPGIPSMGTCMGCHLIVGGSDSANDLQIQLVRKAWNEKKPIEWVRVHSLARHVAVARGTGVRPHGLDVLCMREVDMTR